MKVFLKVINIHLYTIQKETNQEISYHMVPNVISHQRITKHMATHVISHKLICESQCTMTKWNPIIKLTLLNNYLNNCVITSSYTSSYRVSILLSTCLYLCCVPWYPIWLYLLVILWVPMVLISIKNKRLVVEWLYLFLQV
jgi:hypothetical protein